MCSLLRAQHRACSAGGRGSSGAISIEDRQNAEFLFRPLCISLYLYPVFNHLIFKKTGDLRSTSFLPDQNSVFINPIFFKVVFHAGGNSLQLLARAIQSLKYFLSPLKVQAFYWCM